MDKEQNKFLTNKFIQYLTLYLVEPINRASLRRLIDMFDARGNYGNSEDYMERVSTELEILVKYKRDRYAFAVYSLLMRNYTIKELNTLTKDEILKLWRERTTK